MELKIDKSIYKVGIYALLGSAVLTSVSQVFYANQVQAVHPFLFTGISFFITALYFQIFASKQKTKVNWKEDKKALLKLNIASAITFMCFYFALKYVEPAIVSSLEMGIAPLFILILMVLQRKTISLKKWMISIGTLTACFILIGAVISGKSGIASQISSEMFIGIIASILCGIGAVYCSEYSRELSDRGWTSSMILSKRYVAIILISFIFTYDLIILYFVENIIWILIVTFGGVLIPNYLLQKGIQYTNTFLVMMSLSFIPVFTFLFQLFDMRIQFSFVTAIGVSLLFICGISSLRDAEDN
ncbi:DMT family transporter [Lysinibacillus xylanilyticus]|uniref:DMT family transporter n=1 Tax=Lysinibacillus xylanilyticus TaxID=582475 RepID=UPI003D080DC8